MKNGLIIDKYGDKCYYLNDKFHREDGPAFDSDLGKEWRIHGKLHREDGPAVIWRIGSKAYYLNGIGYSEEDYWNEIKRRKSLNYIFLNIKKELSK